MNITDVSALTERQRDVLNRLRAGETPTEIGRALGISSQGVHGHLRRLRSRGYQLPYRLPQRARTTNGRTAGTDGALDPAAPLAAVRDAIDRQRQLVEQRLSEIDAAIQALQAERTALHATQLRLDDQRGHLCTAACKTTP